MSYSVEYYHSRVLAEIESWPVDVVADYARLVELLIDFGPDLRLPHSRALGDGLFELRPRGRSVQARAVYCFRIARRVIILHAFVKKTRKAPDRELAIARRRRKELRHV